MEKDFYKEFHKMCNCVGVIAGNAEMLKEDIDKLPDDIKFHIELIHKESCRLNEILGELRYIKDSHEDNLV